MTTPQGAVLTAEQFAELLSPVWGSFDQIADALTRNDERLRDRIAALDAKCILLGASLRQADEECGALAARVKELEGQVRSLGQYSMCAKNGTDGLSHGGAALCQSCVNAAMSKLAKAEEALREIAGAWCEDCKTGLSAHCYIGKARAYFAGVGESTTERMGSLTGKAAVLKTAEIASHAGSNPAPSANSKLDDGKCPTCGGEVWTQAEIDAARESAKKLDWFFRDDDLLAPADGRSATNADRFGGTATAGSQGAPLASAAASHPCATGECGHDDSSWCDEKAVAGRMANRDASSPSAGPLAWNENDILPRAEHVCTEECGPCLDNVVAVCDENEELRADNQRLRAALEFYADASRYRSSTAAAPFTTVEHDSGDIARQALEGTK